MSVMYGGGPGAYGPPRKVNFGWIGEAWSLFGANAGAWIVAILVMGILPLIILGVAGVSMGLATSLTAAQNAGTLNSANPFAVYSAMPLGFLALMLVFSLLYLPFMYSGIYGMAVKQVRGELISASDVFRGGSLMLPMLGLIITIYLVNMVSSLLFALLTHIVGGGPTMTPGPNGRPTFSPGGGGYYIALLLQSFVGLLLITVALPTYALVADRRGVVEAIRLGVGGMANDLGRGALLLFVFGILYMLSIIPCGLGLLVTVPMWFLLSALAYRDMIGIPGMSVPAAPSYGAPQAGVWPPPPTVGQAPPVWGQTPTQAPPPEPPRPTLGGDPLDNPPPGTP